MNAHLTEQLRGSVMISENDQPAFDGASVEDTAEWWGDIGKLAVDLAKAQAEFQPVRKSSQNPFFKRSDGSGGAYADLAEVIDATRPALSKYGFAVVQLPSASSGTVTVTTLLLHQSGGGIRATLTLPAQKGEKIDVQTIGSAMTYARRFSYQAVVHVAGEEDDDGNQAATVIRSKEEQARFAEEKVAKMKAERKAPKSKEPVDDIPKPSAGIISEAQRRRLWTIARKRGWEEVALRDLVGRHGFEHTAEITEKAYDAIISDIEGEGSKA